VTLLKLNEYRRRTLTERFFSTSQNGQFVSLNVNFDESYRLEAVVIKTQCRHKALDLWTSGRILQHVRAFNRATARILGQYA
jgi:hypothetical protein